MRKIGRAALCIRRFRNSTKTAPLTLPLAKLEAQLQRTLAGDGTIEPPHLGGLDLHRPTLQGPGLQCTPTTTAVSREPGINAASGKAQRLDHRFWALARLHSFNRTNPNLLQRLMVEGTSVASFHALHCILCILIYEHINISGQWMMVATNRAGSHESETWVSLGSTQRLWFLKILHDHPRKNHLPWCERDDFVWRGPSPIFLDHALAQQQGKFHIGNHLFVAGLKCSDLLQACHERRDPRT